MAEEAKSQPVSVAGAEAATTVTAPPAALPKTAQALADMATDLMALRDAAVEAAGVSGPLWISYLFVLLYLAIAAGAVTHKDLFLERPVKLPFLGVDLPLTGFFALGPALFLILHTYVLLHFVLLADKVGAFHRELEKQIAGAGEAERRTNLRRQLPSNIFIQFLAGPRDVRFGVTGWMLRLIAWISLVFGPVLLLVFFQLRFLPYHHEAMTWWHRIAVLVDIALLWWFWPQIAMATLEDTWRHRAVGLAMRCCAVLPVLLVFFVATFPGERLHTALPPVRFVPVWVAEEWLTVTLKGSNVFNHRTDPATLHELLLDGEVDQVNRRPTSPFSNVLVLPGVEAYDPTKFDEDKKFTAVRETVSLRGRHLEGAVLIEARLRKADLTGAFLRDASLVRAQMQGASLIGAQLQGASLVRAQLQGASLVGAQLRGARFEAACVWRTDTSRMEATAVRVVAPRSVAGPVDRGDEPADCDWSAKRREELRAMVAREVPDGKWRDEALGRFDARLLPDPPAMSQDEDVTTARWWGLAAASPDDATFVAARASLGCGPANAPYVARGLLRQMGALAPVEWQRTLAGGLRDPGCAGAANLTEEEKAQLERIRDHGLPPAPGR